MAFNLKNFVGALVEDDSPAPRVQSQPDPSAAPPVVPQISFDVVDRDDETYKKLFAKTDFTGTAIYQVIRKYLAPIDNIPSLDEKTKFKIAMQQAQAQENLSAEAISATFDKFKSDLDLEQQKFNNAMESATKIEIDGRKAKASDLIQQAQGLQSQAAKLNEDAFATGQRIQALQHRFEQAHNIRSAEIAAEQAKYASLLA